MSQPILKFETVTGRRLGERFRCEETAGAMDPERLYALLKGEPEPPCVIYVARRSIPPDVCARISENFRTLCEASGGNRDDYVAVAQIGANQFEKTTAEYFDQVRRTRAAVEALFDGIGASGRELVLQQRLLAELCAARGATFRAATFAAQSASPCTARSWQTRGTLSLLAHEDLAQLNRARADGFEIGSVRHVISANACLSSAGGGRLVVWDIAPDGPSRARLGVEETGYPYPLECLEAFPRLEIDLDAGDSYFLCSAFVHAVTAVTAGQRITAGRFLGFVDDRTLVHWT